MNPFDPYPIPPSLAFPLLYPMSHSTDSFLPISPSPYSSRPSSPTMVYLLPQPSPVQFPILILFFSLFLLLPNPFTAFISLFYSSPSLTPLLSLVLSTSILLLNNFFSFNAPILHLSVFPLSLCLSYCPPETPLPSFSALFTPIPPQPTILPFPSPPAASVPSSPKTPTQPKEGK